MNMKPSLHRIIALRSAKLAWTGAESFRHGVTIVEVLFAIGVILIGLLGVLAIIPVAGRDAGEAIRIDTASRMAQTISNELVSRDIESLDGLVYSDNDPLGDDFNYPGPSQRLGPAGAVAATDVATLTPANQIPARELDKLLDRPVIETSPPSGPWLYKGLDSPGLMGFFSGDSVAQTATFRRTRMASFCLDPDFLARNPTYLLGPQRNAYQPARFPYYSEWYSPVFPPQASLGSVGSIPPLPRMYRVGIGVLGRYARQQIADALTHSDGSLMMYRPRDRTVPPSQVMVNLDPAGATSGTRQDKNRYTWIATVTPPLDGSNHYNMTVVVIESREPFAGLYDLGSTPGNAGPDVNPISERVCWVTNPVQLGSTIEVTAYGSDAIDDTIRPGQWVMLSRQVYETDGSGTPLRPHRRLPAAHRWYRVQRVTEAERGAFTQAPYTNLTGCWRRQVVLEGPTWEFGTANNGNGGAAEVLLADDTYMTIVHGAVAIKERTIELDF